jgi:glycosyltransferase involved in cell wall biosynthesis
MVELASPTRPDTLPLVHTQIAVAIPCLNTQKKIGDVVIKARQYADEVIVINDGSTDLTARIADLAGATVINHPVNLGKGAAMKTAASNTDADILVFMDGDGQHDPEDIPNLILPILQGKADFVIGSRFLSDSKITSIPLSRKITNGLASVVISVLISFIIPAFQSIHSNSKKGSPGTYSPLYAISEWKTNPSSPFSLYRLITGKFKWITDCTSGFTAVKRKNWEKLNLVSDQYQIETEMIFEQAKNGFVIAETPISCNWQGNLSRLSVLKDGLKTILILTRKVAHYSNSKSGSELGSTEVEVSST